MSAADNRGGTHFATPGQSSLNSDLRLSDSDASTKS
jgi:hypothetical protein